MSLSPRNWAMTLLERCSDHFGRDYVMKKLQKPVVCFSLFSGVECARAAWAAIDEALWNLWGIRSGVQWAFAAPWWPTSFIFTCSG